MPKNCRHCGFKLQTFLDFGSMPIANAFLEKNEFNDEYFFNLQTAFCSSCFLVQLIDQPEPKKMFHHHYPFFTSSSQRMIHHFEKWADEIINTQTFKKDAFVIEIGCNDGTFLKQFQKQKIKHLGIEPSKNVAEMAQKNGITVENDFFNQTLAEKIKNKNGLADLITSANVICHIPDIHSLLGGVKKLLKDDGLFIFEDPYLGDIIEKASFDQIYDEHVFYFSCTSVSKILSSFNLKLIKAQPIWTHGGSMRYTISHQDAYAVDDSVFKILEKEKQQGLDSIKSYFDFAHQVKINKSKLIQLLTDLKNKNKKIVGYAATSKSTTVINYCGINSQHLDFISDTTPLKQGKFSPGAHIPVKSYQEFKDDYPDYALLFGWNHAQEILEKEKDFSKNGGKWIHYIPEVEIT